MLPSTTAFHLMMNVFALPRLTFQRQLLLVWLVNRYQMMVSLTHECCGTLETDTTSVATWQTDDMVAMVSISIWPLVPYINLAYFSRLRRKPQYIWGYWRSCLLRTLYYTTRMQSIQTYFLKTNTSLLISSRPRLKTSWDLTHVFIWVNVIVKFVLYIQIRCSYHSLYSREKRAIWCILAFVKPVSTSIMGRARTPTPLHGTTLRCSKTAFLNMP